jgi:hypothetical protein
MSTPVPTAGRRPATCGACPAKAAVADHAVRSAMVSLITERIFDASTVDGATASPLMHEEAANLAGAVVDLIEECQPDHLSPAEILAQLRGPLRSVNPFRVDL